MPEEGALMPDEVYGNTSTEDVREFPNAVDVERQVLGVMLLSRDAISLATARLTTSSFYLSAHREVFDAVRALVSADVGVDAISVIERLRTTDKLERARGEDYIRKLVSQIGTTANIEDHISIVRRVDARRELITLADKMGRGAFDEATEIETLLGDAAAAIAILSGTASQEAWTGNFDVVSQMIEGVYSPTSPRIPTGLAGLDRILSGGGFARGSLNIIGGLTGHLKTSLLLQILTHGLRSGLHVGLGSWEMEPSELIARTAVTHSHLTPHLTPVMKDEVDEIWTRSAEVKASYVASLAEVGCMNLHHWLLHGNGDQFIADVIALHAAEGLDLLGVDYIQLAGLANKETRQEEISEFARSLKSLAARLKIPVIALSQFNNAAATAAKDTKSRPGMESYRGSGAIKEHATTCIVIYRPNFSNNDTVTEVIEICVDKQRNGKFGVVGCHWDAQKQLISGIDTHHEEPAQSWYEPPEKPEASQAKLVGDDDDYEF